MNVPYLLSAALAALMLAQSLLGLLFQGQYRDVAWIKAAWFGNDWVTLIVAVPLVVRSVGFCCGWICSAMPCTTMPIISLAWP
jgi:hypothetical protein